VTEAEVAARDSKSEDGSWTQWRGALLAWLVVIVVGFVKYGFGVYPSWPFYHQIAVQWQDPALEPPADYLYSNPVSAWLAGVLGLQTYRQFFFWHVALVVLALGLPFFMPAVRKVIGQRRVMLMIIVGGPLLPVLAEWIMSYDPVTIMAATVAALARHRILAWAGWVLMAFNHAPLAEVGLLLSIPIVLLIGGRSGLKDSVVRVIGSVVSVVIGVLLINALVSAWGGSTSRLEWLQARGLETFWNHYIIWVPLIFFSALGVGWLILTDSSMRGNRVVRALLLEALIVSIVIPLIVEDASRDIALAMMVPLFLWIASSRATVGDRALLQVWERYRIAAVIIPIILVWQGTLIYLGWGVTHDLPAFWQALP
jgi:hypothetical protein